MVDELTAGQLGEITRVEPDPIRIGGPVQQCLHVGLQILDSGHQHADGVVIDRLVVHDRWSFKRSLSRD